MECPALYLYERKGRAVMEEDRKKEPETIQETAEDGMRKARQETAEGGMRKAVQETAEDGMLETVRTGARQTAKQSGGSMFEGIYDRLPDISVRAVDRFIIFCIAAFIAVILVGILKANHVF